MNKTALIEGIKEIVRVALIAALPLLITGLESGSLDWRLVATAAVIAVLKGVDKFVHKNDNIKASGILPF